MLSLLFVSLLSIFIFQVSASGKGREGEAKQIEMTGAESPDLGWCQHSSP